MDLDPGGPKTYGSEESGSGTEFAKHNRSRNLFDMVWRGGGGGGEGVVYGNGEHVHLLPLAGLLKGSLLQHLQLHAKKLRLTHCC